MDRFAALVGMKEIRVSSPLPGTESSEHELDQSAAVRQRIFQPPRQHRETAHVFKVTETHPLNLIEMSTEMFNQGKYQYLDI